MPESAKEKPEVNSPSAQSALPEKYQQDYDEKRDEMVGEAEKTFEDRISAGSIHLDEKALFRLRKLKEKQKREIASIFEKHRQEFGKRVQTAPANRDAMAAELIKTAAADAGKRITALKQVIEAKTKETYITTDEAAEIEKAVIGVENLAREDKKLQAVAEKIFNGETLTDDDYAYIVTVIKPCDYEVATRRTDIRQSFEATSSGVLVGLMNPAQRFRLIQVFMDSPKKAESAQLIEAFLRTGIISRDQGESLLLEAVRKGIITRERYQTDFKAKLDSGHYQEETAKFRAIIEQERCRDYRGKFSENIVSRVVGLPAVGGVVALWGSVLAILNIWTTLSNKDDHNKLKSLLANPYIYAGLGAAALGTEVATGTIKKGAGVVGGGVIGRGIDTMSESDEDQKKEVRERARGRVADIMLNSPRELVTYLEEGGFVKIMELRKSKIAKNERPSVKIAELIPLETNPIQTARLNGLKTLSATSENNANIALTTIGEASVILDIDSDEAFKKLVAEIRQKQK